MQFPRPVGVRPQGQVIGGWPGLLSYDRASTPGGAHMRTVKILTGLVGGIIVLIVAALIAVWLLVNPNVFKGRIASAVQESTGRALILKGDITLSVFPWVALQLGPASLGNPPGFGEESFLAFNHVGVRVKLWPLLSDQLVVDRIDLDGLDLRLRKNAQGVGNWENFGGSQKLDAKAGANQGPGMRLLQLAGIRITNGRLSYQDLVIEKITLDTGAFGERGVTPISLSFDANPGLPGESLSLSAKFDLSTDSKEKHFNLAAVNFSGQLRRPGSEPPVHWEMTAPAMELDLSAQTVAVPAFAMSYANARVTGRLQASKIMDDVGLAGSVSLAPLVLREFAPRFGITLPKTSDPRALGELSASGDFSYGAGGWRLTRMQAQLDDTQLKGSFAMLGEPHSIKFDLAVDQINLDRYLSPDHGPAPVPAAAKPEGAKPAPEAPKLPDADGTFTMGSLHFSPLDFTAVRMTLGLKSNVLHLYPFQAQIDGGSYSGNVTADVRGAVPNLSVDEHLSGVDVARLLSSTSYKGRLSGRGNVNLRATARGAALDPVLQTLNGHFDANLAEGAIEGVDLAYAVALAESLVKHTAQPTRSNPQRTQFEAFKMSAEIVGGISTTKDLTISSPVLRVTGQGSANLVSKAIDYQVLASILKAPGSTLADIPVKVGGTYLNPTIRPDVEALAKTEMKQKLQDVLKKNGLQGLFGK
jgi:AsmA protein